MRKITGYDIIIHWDDGETEDLDMYGPYPYIKSLDYVLNSIEEEVNSELEEERNDDE